MTDDPFLRLNEIAIPEPDPAQIEAVANRALAAFEEASGKGARVDTAREPSLLSAIAALFLRIPAVPVIACAAGLALLFTWAPWTTLRDDGPRLADQEPLPAPQERPRFGAQPDQQPIAPPPQDAIVTRHSFGDLEIVSHETADEVTLAIILDGREIPFDRRLTGEGVTLRLLDAFTASLPGQGELLLVHSEMGGAVNWDAFVISADRISLSGAMSQKIHDAGSRKEVIDRLSGP